MGRRGRHTEEIPSRHQFILTTGISDPLLQELEASGSITLMIASIKPKPNLIDSI